MMQFTKRVVHIIEQHQSTYIFVAMCNVKFYMSGLWDVEDFPKEAFFPE